MRIKLLAATSLAAVTMFAFASSAQANHSWGNYHWARSANPFTVTLNDNVTSAWDSYLRTAGSDWSRSTVLDAVVQGSFGSARQCRPDPGQVEVCNDTYGNNGWLGIAPISVSGSHITRGYVKVNDTYFNTAQYNTSAWRNLVMCQEVGHAFGLDHQDENFNNANLGTCMDYTNDPGTNQHPNAHDYAQLETIYAHTDGAAANFRGSEVTDNPASWGRMVASSQRHSTFVRDFGNGNVVVTHVIWA